MLRDPAFCFLSESVPVCCFAFSNSNSALSALCILVFHSCLINKNKSYIHFSESNTIIYSHFKETMSRFEHLFNSFKQASYCSHRFYAVVDQMTHVHHLNSLCICGVHILNVMNHCTEGESWHNVAPMCK